MFRDEAILDRSKHDDYKIIHNHNDNPANLFDTPPVFKSTKRLPGTSEYVPLTHKRKVVKSETRPSD